MDFIKDNKVANRMGVAILLLVWILDTLFIGARILLLHEWPLFSAFQATMLFSWLLISLSGIITLFYRVDFFVFFLNLCGLLFALFDVMVHGHVGSGIIHQSDLLVVHISAALLSYIAFSIAAIFSLLYLLESYSLRLKRFDSGPFRRLPPLAQLDRFAFRASLVGVPLLFLAIVLGAIWYYILTGHVVDMDAKPVISVLLFLLYASYLYLHVKGKVSGRKAAWLNILAFVLVIINFLVVSAFVSSFHRW